tara:strand:+ start:2017 stop:2229 length:213 start_codon:yes stop_codon:yes gene_type:complete
MGLIEKILDLMPVWFGIGFLGPVLAEIYFRTPLNSYFPLPITAETSHVYGVCMIFGGLYGLVAWKTGRWI